MKVMTYASQCTFVECSGRGYKKFNTVTDRQSQTKFPSEQFHGGWFYISYRNKRTFKDSNSV